MCLRVHTFTCLHTSCQRPPRGPSLLSPIPHAADRRPHFGPDSRKRGVRSVCSPCRPDTCGAEARVAGPPESKGQQKPSLPRLGGGAGASKGAMQPKWSWLGGCRGNLRQGRSGEETRRLWLWAGSCDVRATQTKPWGVGDPRTSSRETLGYER